MYDLSNRAILVTGSTRGIGRAAARLFAASGATVGIHGRDPEKVELACSEIGGNTVPLAADLSDPDEAGRITREFVAKAGRIDGLVNNAGGGKAVAFRGVKLESWRRTFATNLEAAVVASQEAYNAMRQAGGGSIVNVASLAAHGPGKWMGADYAASKAGLVSLTKSLALEAARLGIRVNAVSPGFVNTDMTAVLREEQKETLGIPMGRLAEPTEIASVISFLLSDQSAYVTGQVFHVNGGLLM